jgi:hypothetical protein
VRTVTTHAVREAFREHAASRARMLPDRDLLTNAYAHARMRSRSISFANSTQEVLMSIRHTLAILPVAGILAIGAPVAASAQAPAPQVAGQATFGNLISALNNISAQIGRLNALNNLTVSNVRVVNVSDLLNGNNVNALNNALNNNNVQILNLRNVLNNNEVVKNALNSNNVAISRVVAIDVLSGGDVVVFQR